MMQRERGIRSHILSCLLRCLAVRSHTLCKGVVPHVITQITMAGMIRRPLRPIFYIRNMRILLRRFLGRHHRPFQLLAMARVRHRRQGVTIIHRPLPLVSSEHGRLSDITPLTAQVGHRIPFIRRCSIRSRRRLQRRRHRQGRAPRARLRIQFLPCKWPVWLISRRVSRAGTSELLPMEIC